MTKITRGNIPRKPPFTISELEEIYPAASARSKEDEAYKEEAMHATYLVQHGHRGYQAVLQHILNVSVTDLKRNYANLNVDFDLWKGESDAQPYIPDMVERLKKEGYAYESNGALVVDVKEETDTKEVPPCMILKSDGGIPLHDDGIWRRWWNAGSFTIRTEVIYVVDKRQEMHFVQVFRCAKKTGIVKPENRASLPGLSAP